MTVVLYISLTIDIPFISELSNITRVWFRVMCSTSKQSHFAIGITLISHNILLVLFLHNDDWCGSWSNLEICKGNVLQHAYPSKLTLSFQSFLLHTHIHSSKQSLLKIKVGFHKQTNSCIQSYIASMLNVDLFIRYYPDSWSPFDTLKVWVTQCLRAMITFCPWNR